MKTNGNSASPKAIGGPAGGASGAVGGDGHEPTSIDQYAGTQQQGGDRDRAPLPPGRERFDGGRRKSATAPSAQPFTAPAVSPRTKYFCRAKKTMSGNAIEMNAAAVSRCQFSPREPTRFARAIVSTRFCCVPPRNT